MFRWRLAVITLLLGLIGLPVALPLIRLLAMADAWRGLREGARLTELAINTLRLIGLTLALSLPAGVVLAVLLYRTDLPCRRLFRSFLLLSLFVPLPLFASGWQAAVGSGGWLAWPAWNRPARRRPGLWLRRLDLGGSWGQGVASAAWIHAAGALAVGRAAGRAGAALGRADLEEDALTAAGPGRVLWRVTLPRARAAIVAAAAWVGLSRPRPK